jgi:hypothetical protein
VSDDHLGMMSHFEAEAHSFIIRLWREGSSDAPATPGWRGRIEHVQSGRYQYFSRLDDLPGILHEQTGSIDKLDDIFEPRPTDRSDT